MLGVLPGAPPPPPDAITVEGTVAEVLYHGAMKRIELTTATGRLVAAVPSATGAPLGQGDAVRVAFPRSALHLMDGG
jgi:hypothetical protein